MGKALTEISTSLFKFRLSDQVNEDTLTINVEILLKGEMKNYLLKVLSEIGAPNDKVAGSILIKRYAFFAVIALYTMSKTDRRLNVKPSNVTLVSHYEDKDWLPKFYFEDLTFEAFNGSREQWRKQFITDLFANHLYLIIEEISLITKISKLILWENVAVYLFWLYESFLTDESDLNEKIKEDFRFLFHEAPGHVFGPYHHNPLSKYDSDKISHQLTGEYIRFRKTCCFSYQLNGNGKRCSTCPCIQIDEDGRCQSEQSFCSTIRSLNE